MARINLYLPAGKEEEIRQLAEETGFLPSNMLEAVALCLSRKELLDLQQRHAKMKELERTSKGALRKEVLDRLKGMSPEQLAQVLANANAVIEGSQKG